MKIAPLLLLTVATLAACNKDDDKPDTQPDFVIDGIRDVHLDSSIGSNILPIVVSRPANSTTQEVVTLSTPDLPAGFSASFSSASGTPSFASTVTFAYDYSGSGGTFPAKIVGASASGSKTYNLNLTVPAFTNGWVLDGEMYNATTVQTSNTSTAVYLYAGAASLNGTLQLQFAYPQLLPTATKTVKIVKDPLAADEVSFYLTDRNNIDYYTTGTGAPTGTITVENGKYGFRCNDVEVAIASGGAIKKRIHCKFSQ